LAQTTNKYFEEKLSFMAVFFRLISYLLRKRLVKNSPIILTLVMFFDILKGYALFF